jgi:hypothetical protein
LGYSGAFDIFIKNSELRLQRQANLHSSCRFRYAWSAHRGGHWAATVASGIPFGLGSFVLFVSISASLVKTGSFLQGSFFSKLSSISYLVDSYGAAASASGRSFGFFFLFVVYTS